MYRRENTPPGEVIENKMNLPPKKNVTKLIDDSFFKTELDKGIPFHVRRTNLLRKEANKKFTAKRTHNVPDKELEERLKRKEKQAAEEKRDQTWGDFLKQY